MAAYDHLIAVSMFAIVLSWLGPSAYMFARAHNGALTLDIIHRDAPESPFYNPTETLSQRIANTLARSTARENRYSLSSTSTLPSVSAQSTLMDETGEYLMMYSIGTPPATVYGIPDTGSDMVWLQCLPCQPSCYNQSTPLFDPSNSTSYRKLPCYSLKCQTVGNFCSSGMNDSCGYSLNYGDNSFSTGQLVYETFTLGSPDGKPISFPNIIVGCGHNNGGIFTQKSSGIVGLGAGGLSLVSQLGSSVNWKFSYCLVPFSDLSSKLSFGEIATDSGNNSVTTPLVMTMEDAFYRITLEAISVGEKKIELNQSQISPFKEGNMVIDSGATLTLLPNDTYSQLEAFMAEGIQLERVKDPNNLLSLCYNNTAEDIDAPVLTVHFRNADVQLKSGNTFVKVADDVFCFAFRAIDARVVYGNWAQRNFLVSYDIVQKTVSFKSMNCSIL